MDFSFITFNLEILSDPGFNAMMFSVIGMAVVFGGLTLIAAYIALLPKMLAFFSKLKNKARLSTVRSRKKKADAGDIDDETLIAIVTALHLYQFSADDNRKITWKRHLEWDSSWQRAGRFEAMNHQGNILAPRR